MVTSRVAVNYGFVIDNRRCIGCHACTVACKTEHDDPIGINKTWVQYIEKGVFPHATRSFHVLRCNHCAEAPCVEICPTASLVTRADGIVDFDPGRCIGCKACMQACPYDAIVLHPESGTATKCNYCSHRVDVGREPACVTVCPAEAIIVGDLNDPTSKIARLVATEETMVRKPEKGTAPNLFYIEGDSAALDPSASIRSEDTMWGFRPRDGLDGIALEELGSARERPRGHPRRAYDIAQRHAGSWGWKVSAYLFTKSVAAGAFLIPVLALLLGRQSAGELFRRGVPAALVMLGVTGLFLVVDLKRPERFLWVLLRPQWRSWLVRGAYIITAYAAVLTLALLVDPAAGGFGAGALAAIGGVLAAGTASYSGWLFGQAKGRDLWQSPLAPVHLLVQAVVAGLAMFAVIAPALFASLSAWLIVALVGNGALVALEVWGRHATADAGRAAKIMQRGWRGQLFHGGVIVAGHGLPLLLLAIGGSASGVIAGLFALVGLACYEHLWVDAPQRVALA